MINDVKISVVTATWNCANTLPDCLASFSRQSYPHKEHIIVDGASTDLTCTVVEKHLDQISIFQSEPDNGIYDALNKGIRLATGDVIGFLHSDDLYASDNVLAKIAIAFKDPAICAVYGGLDYVSQYNSFKVIRKWRAHQYSGLKDIFNGWMPAHPTFYVRREWYSRIGGFDASYQISADYLSVLKLFIYPDFKTLCIPEVLVKMRVGGASNKSLAAVINKTKEDWRALRFCDFTFFGALRTIVCKNMRKIQQFFNHE